MEAARAASEGVGNLEHGVPLPSTVRTLLPQSLFNNQQSAACPKEMPLFELGTYLDGYDLCFIKRVW